MPVRGELHDRYRTVQRMAEMTLTKNEKIEMRKVVKILKRWGRVAWSWLLEGTKEMLVWVEQKKSEDYYMKNVQEIKAIINRIYDEEEEDNDDEDILVFGYLNRLVKHYEGKN